MKIIWNFERFNTLTLKQSFLETKTFSKKMENRFSVESTEIENVTFPYKSALPEVNVKTNIDWSVQNGPTTKDAVLPVTTLLLVKLLFQFKTSYKELSWCTNYPNVQMSIFILKIVLQEERIEYQYKFIQLLNNLLKVGYKWKNADIICYKLS